MNPVLVTLGALGLIGLVLTVIVVAAQRGAFDGLLDPTDEDEWHE